jgi:hypothetical protein
MATVSKVLFRGQATQTANTVVYTVPASTTTVLTEIVLVKATGMSSQSLFYCNLNGIPVAYAVPHSGQDSIVIGMKQVLTAGQTIQAWSDTGYATVYFHFSGVEIS